jgi:heme exporter protein D
MKATESLSFWLSIAINTLLIAIYVIVVLWNERELVSKALKKLPFRR